jgi:hypothetical protein
MSRRAALAAALAVVATSASAQFGGRRGMGRGGGTGDGAKGGERREPTPPLEVTLHEFHEDLKLAATQEPLFERYAEAIRALANDLARERSRSASEAKAALMARIDRNVDTMRNRLAAVEDIAAAAKTLYASLSAEQQTLADPRLATLMLLPLGAKPPAA